MHRNNSYKKKPVCMAHWRVLKISWPPLSLTTVCIVLKGWNRFLQIKKAIFKLLVVWFLDGESGKASSFVSPLEIQSLSARHLSAWFYHRDPSRPWCVVCDGYLCKYIQTMEAPGDQPAGMLSGSNITMTWRSLVINTGHWKSLGNGICPCTWPHKSFWQSS